MRLYLEREDTGDVLCWFPCPSAPPPDSVVSWSGMAYKVEGHRIDLESRERDGGYTGPDVPICDPRVYLIVSVLP